MTETMEQEVQNTNPLTGEPIAGNYHDDAALAKPDPKRKMGRPTTTAQIKDLREQIGELREGISEITAAIRTLNGKAIPVESEHLVPFAATDQGRAERESERVAAGRPEPLDIRITRSEYDNAVDAFGDADPYNWDVKDPLTEVADRHREPGMRYRFLDEKAIEQLGMRRWEPVKDKKTGDLVKSGKTGGMILAKMPEEMATARNKHYSNVADDNEKAAQEHHIVQQEKILREAGNQGVNVSGMGPLRHGETLHGNTQMGQGEATIGLRSTRGLPAN